MTIRMILLYTGVAFTAFVVSLYSLFPGEKAADWFARGLRLALPEVSAEINPFVPVPPAGIRTWDMLLHLPEGYGLKLDSLTLFPALTTLFSQEKRVRFNSSLLEGRVEGIVESQLTPEGRFNAALVADGIRVSDLVLKTSDADIRLSFVLKGKSRLDRPAGAIMSGQGELALNRCVAAVKSATFPQLNLDKISMDTITVHYSVAGSQVTIENVQASGPDLEFTLSGTIQVARELPASRMNLKGNVKPSALLLKRLSGMSSMVMLLDQTFKGGVPFTLTGTLENPMIRL